MSIPPEITDAGGTGGIIDTVAEVPANTSVPEDQPYMISFEKYNEAMCEIDCLGKNKHKKIVQVLKQIGMKVRSTADFQRHSIDRIPVTCSGGYKPLFNRLDPGVDLKELKLQGTGRVFYFDLEHKKTLFVVAITENHLETDQNRR